VKNLSLVILIIFFFQACERPRGQKINLSVNGWIGYSPLFYLMEKGWLKPLNIKLHTVVSLRENVHTYLSKKTDAFTATQYEYHLVKKQQHSLIPIITFDRSNGGDVIMSNVTLKEIQKSTQTIDAYLEIDTINYALLLDFLKVHKIPKSRINFIDINQVDITSRFKPNVNRPALIVTYIPHNIELAKKGLKTIADTREGLDLLVVDALYLTKELFDAEKERFQELKKLIDKALVNLDKDPKEYFEKVAPYLDGISYDDFINSLKDIKWLNKALSPELQIRLKDSNFPTKHLL